MTASLPREKVIYPEGCFFKNVRKPLLGCDLTLLTAPPLESPWTMHKTNFHPSRGYKKPNVGSVASFFRDTGVCPRICLRGSGKKFERLWRKKALALFCQDLCFLNSFIPKPVTSLLLKKKKPIQTKCVSHHILCPQPSLCLCISRLAPRRHEKWGDLFSGVSGVGCKGGLRVD